MAKNVIEFTIKGVDKFSGAFKGAAQGMKTLAIGAAAVGAAALAAGVATFAFANKVADAQDKVAKFSTRIGVGVAELSKMQYVADRAGISTETFNMAVQRMTRRVGEAAVGTGEAKDALHSLGINAEEFIKLPLDERLESLADSLAMVDGDAEKLRLSFKLFDSEGTSMIQMLKGGSDAMRELGDDAARLGLIMDQQSTANAEAFKDSMTRATGAMTGMTRSIGNKLIPVLTGLANAFADTMADSSKKIVEFAGNFAKGFLLMAALATQFLTGFWTSFKKIFSAEGFNNFVSAAQGAFKWIFNYALQVFPAIGKVLISMFKIAFESATVIGKWAWDSIKSIFTDEEPLDLGTVLFSRLPEATALAREELANSFEDYKVIVLDGAQALSDAVVTMTGVNVEEAQRMVDEMLLSFEEFGTASEKVSAGNLKANVSMFKEMGKISTQYLKDQGTAGKQYAKGLTTVMNSAITAISAGIADVIVDGGNMMEIFDAIGKQVLKSLITLLIDVGLQRAFASTIAGAANLKETSAQVGANVGKAASGAYAAIAGIPIIGPGLAPGAAAIAAAGASAAGAPGIAAATAGAFHGGSSYVPKEASYLLDKGERVLSPNQNADLTSFLSGNGGGGGSTVIENLYVSINTDSLLNASDSDLEEFVAGPLIRVLDKLDDSGVRQAALERSNV